MNTMPNGSYLSYSINARVMFINIDVNGAKGPNLFGHDVFLLYLKKSDDSINGYKATGKI